MVSNYDSIKREVNLGVSKLDFLVGNTYLEVKTPLTTLNVKYGKNIKTKEVTPFSSTDRFTKHINELAGSLDKNERAIMLAVHQYEITERKEHLKSTNYELVKSTIDKAVSLTLTYEKDDGTTETETITNDDNNATAGKCKVTTKNITNPKTGDNVTTYIILGIISLLGLTITTISKKHLSKSLMAIALVSSIVLPLGVKADSDKISIVFNNTIKVREYTVTFNTNGGTEISSMKVVKSNKR